MRQLGLFLGCFFAFTQLLFAESNLDKRLSQIARQFGLKAIEKPSGLNPKKFVLGRELFHEEELSGNRNISCSTCHSAKFGSSDALPLSIGTGGVGEGSQRKSTKSSGITPRHSPALFNIGHESLDVMFWDGRVTRDSYTGELITPEPELNGEQPKLYKIQENLESALAAQALFPLVSHVEMLGNVGDNEISNSSSRAEAWYRLVVRIASIPKYQKLIAGAYPGQEINISHLANAMAHFQRHRFAVYNTPWDNYLRGDLSALNERQKQGAVLMATKGRCLNCHTGSLLGGRSFQNIVAPQIGPGKDIHRNDEGLFYVTGRDRDRYKFKAPMLRNLKYSAPYFHNGAYISLEEVLDHYTEGANAIDSYRGENLAYFEGNNYFFRLFVETDRYKNFKKKENAHPLMRSKAIRLNSSEKQLLIYFLKTGLSQ